MNKKILITGGAGFIGYHLTKKLLRKNHKILILDNLSRGKQDKDFKILLKNKNVSFKKFDLEKKISIKIKEPDYIFHLAGTVGVKEVNKNPYKTFINNIVSSINLFKLCEKFKRSKLILFSTSEVYSPLIKKNKVKFPINEKNNIILENIVINRDAYYVSKAFNEKLVQFLNNNYLILRPHNIYGPRMGYRHVIPELIKKINQEKNKKKNKTYVFSPSHKRAFCYIDDAIKQIIQLSFNKKVKNSIFNIGNMKEEINMFNLAKLIKKKIYNKSKLKKGKITEGSPKRRIPDMTKTLRFIKLKKFTSLNDGIDKTTDWYLRELT